MRDIEPSDGLLLRAVALTELRDRLSQNFRTKPKLIHGHKLARPVRLAYISRADDHRFAAEQLHLRRFRSERHRAGFVPGRLLQKLD
jgi:hypothetical protein